MYRSEINIKHSNRSHLYWGIDKATGEVVGIDDVRSRGLNCNCKCAASVEDRKYLDKQEILKRMERPFDDPVFDQFHVRWLMCTRCHEIKPSDEMASYGGRHSANMGICRECSRKHSGR